MLICEGHRKVQVGLADLLVNIATKLPRIRGRFLPDRPDQILAPSLSGVSLGSVSTSDKKVEPERKSLALTTTVNQHRHEVKTPCRLLWLPTDYITKRSKERGKSPEELPRRKGRLGLSRQVNLVFRRSNRAIHEERLS